jgi:TolA-binding protein
MEPTFAWTVYGTGLTLLLAVIGMLATALFQQIARQDRALERISEVSGGVQGLQVSVAGLQETVRGMDARLQGVDGKIDKLDTRLSVVERQQRADKAEILERMDVLAERLGRLEER